MLVESGQISDDDDFDFDAHVVYEDHVDEGFMNMMLMVWRVLLDKTSALSFSDSW